MLTPWWIVFVLLHGFHISTYMCEAQALEPKDILLCNIRTRFECDCMNPKRGPRSCLKLFGARIRTLVKFSWNVERCPSERSQHKADEYHSMLPQENTFEAQLLDDWKNFCKNPKVHCNNCQLDSNTVLFAYVHCAHLGRVQPLFTLHVGFSANCSAKQDTDDEAQQEESVDLIKFLSLDAPAFARHYSLRNLVVEQSDLIQFRNRPKVVAGNVTSENVSFGIFNLTTFVKETASERLNWKVVFIVVGLLVTYLIIVAVAAIVRCWRNRNSGVPGTPRNRTVLLLEAEKDLDYKLARRHSMSKQQQDHDSGRNSVASEESLASDFDPLKHVKRHSRHSLQDRLRENDANRKLNTVERIPRNLPTNGNGEERMYYKPKFSVFQQ